MTSTPSIEDWALPTRTRVSGGEVATGVFGHGPPIVLTHGTPAWSYLWRLVIPKLAETHTVHVWDLLGYGDSRLDPGEHPSIARQARALTELVEHWGLPDPVLVGHDIGGGITARTHLVERVSVGGLVLMDAAVLGPWNTPFTEHQQQYAEAYRTMPNNAFEDLIASRIRTATRHRMSPQVLASYLRPWAGAAGQHRWVDQVQAVQHHDTGEAVQRLNAVAVPTLVLWGAEDHWLTPATADRLAGAIPGARRQLIDGGGHFLAEDCPDDVAAAIATFVRTL
jgi:pimeloyl-ACP methyl ester carboxylesterase